MSTRPSPDQDLPESWIKHLEDLAQKMQSPEHQAAVEKLFNATPDELGQTALRESSSMTLAESSMPDEELQALVATELAYGRVLEKVAGIGWRLWTAEQLLQSWPRRQPEPRLFGVRVGTGFRYPSGQFDSQTGKLHPNLVDILAEFDAAAMGWVLLDWLVSPSHLLDGMRPGDVLANRGACDRLIEVARAYFSGDLFE